jgi:hypothetical protein
MNNEESEYHAEPAVSQAYTHTQRRTSVSALKRMQMPRASCTITNNLAARRSYAECKQKKEKAL